MRRVVLAAWALAAAVTINTASVSVEQETRALSRRFKDRAWHVHLALVTPPWALFVGLLPGLNRPVPWPLGRRLRRLGTAFMVVAAGVWLDAFARMGPERTANGYFFGRGPREPVTGGVYRWLRNPMYDAYALALAGSGLQSGNAAFLALAGEAYLLLNFVEARVENRPFKAISIGPPKPQRSGKAV
jgi:protein-S-isoprenylcysteine O-methyltransferase Ste14